MEATTERLVEAYINLRDAIALKEKEHKEALRGLQDQQATIEQELLKRCNEVGGNISIPGVGRVTRRVAKRYWTSDWPALYKIIKDFDAFHLLNQRITNTAMEQFLEEHPDILPTGLNLDSKETVTVTRAS